MASRSEDAVARAFVRTIRPVLFSDLTLRFAIARVYSDFAILPKVKVNLSSTYGEQFALEYCDKITTTTETHCLVKNINGTRGDLQSPARMKTDCANQFFAVLSLIPHSPGLVGKSGASDGTTLS